MCAVWRARPTRTPHPVDAPGAPPILVVGTTDDPATPYAWSQSVAATLDRSALLTRRGTGHVAYLGSACTRGVVDAYLLDLTLPAPGTTCS
jgi:hypothetical protein